MLTAAAVPFSIGQCPEKIAFLFPGEPLHPRFVAVDELVEKPVEPEFLLERVSALLEAAEARKVQTD